MEQYAVISREIAKNEFRKHSWICDLQYYEGPLVSLFKVSDRQDALYIWVDSDAICNRWLVVYVTRAQIISYREQRLTLKSLISEAATVYFVDIDGDLELYRVRQLRSENLPDAYMPGDESFFCEEIIGEGVSLSEPSQYEIAIDGQWFFNDFSFIERRFSQVYALLYSLQRAVNSTASKSNTIFNSLPWRGGFSAVHFFDALREGLPSLHEPMVGQIRYASPGEIVLKLDGEIAIAAASVINSCNVDFAKSCYENSVALLNKDGLRGAPENYHNLSEESKSSIIRQVEVLADAMGMGQYANYLLSRSDNHAVLLKILLATFRRAVDIAKFVDDGRITSI